MSREEAISLLMQVNKILVNNNSWLENTHEPLNMAFDMAIKALEQEPTTKNDLVVDAILRAEVNQVIEDYMDEQYDVLSDRTRERAFGARAVMARINELSSVTPQEPKTGHWIKPTFDMVHNHVCGSCEFICSSCNKIAVDEYDYCPNCGARMVEPQESEVDNGNDD